MLLAFQRVLYDIFIGLPVVLDCRAQERDRFVAARPMPISLFVLICPRCLAAAGVILPRAELLVYAVFDVCPDIYLLRSCVHLVRNAVAQSPRINFSVFFG